MNNNILKAVYVERKRTYHMVNAIAETTSTEPNISTKLKQLIIETQEEVTELYLTVSHDYHNEYFKKESDDNV